MKPNWYSVFQSQPSIKALTAHDQLADRWWRIGLVQWCHGPWSPEMAPGHYGATFSWILLPTGIGRDGELSSGGLRIALVTERMCVTAWSCLQASEMMGRPPVELWLRGTSLQWRVVLGKLLHVA
jgi:hypothetical protein